MFSTCLWDNRGVEVAPTQTTASYHEIAAVQEGILQKSKTARRPRGYLGPRVSRMPEVIPMKKAELERFIVEKIGLAVGRQVLSRGCPEGDGISRGEDFTPYGIGDMGVQRISRCVAPGKLDLYVSHDDPSFVEHVTLRSKGVSASPAHCKCHGEVRAWCASFRGIS